MSAPVIEECKNEDELMALQIMQQMDEIMINEEAKQEEQEQN